MQSQRTDRRRSTEPQYLEQDCGYETPCWIWQRAKNRKGYGVLRVGGRQLYAHRMLYEQHVGQIPTGMTIDHLCRVRSCCNPAHLEPVTGKVNTFRGESFAARNARKTHCVRGHEFTPENTSFNARGQRNCIECRRGDDRRRYRESRHAE